MSYLPDIYQHFERAFPNVHVALWGTQTPTHSEKTADLRAEPDLRTPHALVAHGDCTPMDELLDEGS